MSKWHQYVKLGFFDVIGIEVNMVFVKKKRRKKKHERLWKSNDTRFRLGTVLPSGYNIPRVKFSLGNNKLGAVSIINAEYINLYSAILSLQA